MIYDGHAYCIPDLRGDGGFESREEFQRLLQFITAHHFQPVWRVRDRAPADGATLADLSRPFDLDAVRPARFRATAHGRLEWESGGEVYCKQMLPPLITDMSYDADRTVAEMDYAGVDRALLHRTPYLGIGNDFFAECCRRHPERLQGLAYVREWKIPGDPDAAVRELDRAINRLGLHGLQFLPYFSILYGITEDWDAGGYRPFWDAVATTSQPHASVFSGTEQTLLMPSTRSSLSNSPFTTPATASRSLATPVEVSLWVTRTARMSGSSFRALRNSSTSTARPHGKASSVTSAP